MALITKKLNFKWRGGGCLNVALMTLENMLFCRKTAFTGSHKTHMPNCELEFMPLKDFKVFQGNLALTLAPLADQMLIVCGALCNLLKPLAR